jgi:hypothetical protein
LSPFLSSLVHFGCRLEKNSRYYGCYPACSHSGSTASLGRHVYNPSLVDARFIRGQMRSRYLASDYWDVLLEMIIALNPDLAWMRDEYSMDRFGD